MGRRGLLIGAGVVVVAVVIGSLMWRHRASGLGMRHVMMHVDPVEVTNEAEIRKPTGYSVKVIGNGPTDAAELSAEEEDQVVEEVVLHLPDEIRAKVELYMDGASPGWKVGDPFAGEITTRIHKNDADVSTITPGTTTSTYLLGKGWELSAEREGEGRIEGDDRCFTGRWVLVAGNEAKAVVRFEVRAPRWRRGDGTTRSAGTMATVRWTGPVVGRVAGE